MRSRIQGKLDRNNTEKTLFNYYFLATILWIQLRLIEIKILICLSFHSMVLLFLIIEMKIVSWRLSHFAGSSQISNFAWWKGEGVSCTPAWTFRYGCEPLNGSGTDLRNVVYFHECSSYNQWRHLLIYVLFIGFFRSNIYCSQF